MLTGQNGILTQAQKAKEATEKASAKEKVELAVVGAMSQTRDGILNLENLKKELVKYNGETKNENFPIIVKIDESKFLVKNNGSVNYYKEMSEITGQETINTSTKDGLGNYIVVPAGFKIINPTDNVTAGIVIEDVNHGATAGSQFVWIPVGEVIKDSDGNKETIILSRYTFDVNGDETNQADNEIDRFLELNVSNYGNITAKENIESEESGFRKSAKDNNGYYIGRYEARKKGDQLTEKATDTVYNNITQPDAAILSREMYNDSNFESDLVNSYAWDTAIYFLQKFDTRANKDSLKPYSQQTSLNDILENEGTNSLEDTSKRDIICNVYDMASNCREWITETYNYTSYPCTGRGGECGFKSDYTSSRNYYSTVGNSAGLSFRPIIYM